MGKPEMETTRGSRLFLCLLLVLALTACGPENAPISAAGSQAEVSREIFAMDTFMELRAYGPAAEAALADAAEELRRLDELFSVTDTRSDIWAVNHSQGTPVPVSADTAAVLERALELSRQTGGALDVTVYPVLRAWGFTTGDYLVPSRETLEGLLPYVDDSQVLLDGSAGTVQTPPGAELDLGAVAKGYAGDRCARLLRDRGVTSALLNLGGSTIRTLGVKPDGADWRIAIQDPEDPEAYAGVVETGQGAVNTSGGYERYFESDGQVYWHILDPKTGEPARSGLISVTVLTEDAAEGDGLSTALFVMGLEDAVEFWRSRGGFEFVLIDEAHRLYVSQGAADRFTPMGAYSAAELTVVPYAE